MKTVKIRTSSWHYKLLNFFTCYSAPRYTSICTYFWSCVFYFTFFFVWGCILLFLGLVLLAILAVYGKWIANCLFATMFDNSMLWSLIPISLMSGLGGLIFYFLGTRSGEKLSIKTGGGLEIISSASSSFFGKYCPKVEYID